MATMIKLVSICTKANCIKPGIYWVEDCYGRNLGAYCEVHAKQRQIKEKIKERGSKGGWSCNPYE